jgi:branched-chain amino acid transport system permease protein
VLDIARRTASARQRSPLRHPETPAAVRAAVIVALLLFTLLALPQLLSLYYIDTMTQVAVYSMVTLGLGVLVGRVGLVSLGQVAVLAIGAWVAARLLFATSLPYPLVLLGAGVITMAAGMLIGLPALRMRGLYLALITLMLAGAITVVLATVNFPNGGHGFLGYNGSSVHIPPIRRPGIAASDPAYFRYSVVVAALMFLLAGAHIRTRPGRAWAAIRQSEPAALAAGINTTLYKLWAFALASFITGVAGRSADGWRLQPVGCSRGCAAAATAAGRAAQLGRVRGLADHPVRPRRAAGAHHGPGRAGGSGTKGSRPPGAPAARPRRAPAPSDPRE